LSYAHHRASRELTRASRARIAVPGRFEAGRSDEERGKLSAVHFVKFAFTSEQAAAFRDAEVFLVVDHPGERARARLSDEAKASLMEDLLA